MSKFFRCSNVAIQSLKHCQHSIKRFHRRPCHVSKSFRLFSTTTSNLIENADEYFNDALVSQLHEKKARHDELQVLVSQSADTATPTVFKELGQLSELVINFEKYLQLKKVLVVIIFFFLFCFVMFKKILNKCVILFFSNNLFFFFFSFLAMSRFKKCC